MEVRGNCVFKGIEAHVNNRKNFSMTVIKIKGGGLGLGGRGLGAACSESPSNLV